MHLVRTTVYNQLIDKGINELFHANSVLTSCQFLKKASLLSRGTLERYGFKQTPQSSDPVDKTYSLWFDVFADTVDIHNRGRMMNVYGPVLFVFDTDILLEQSTGRIWVTKINPTKFPGKSDDQRWFQNKGDLIKTLTKGEFDQMVVFRHCGGQLPFGVYLKKIIIDDPHHTITGGIDMYSMAYGALTLAMNESGLNVPIEKRVCKPGCSCQTTYAKNKTKLIKMFTPSIHD